MNNLVYLSYGAGPHEQEITFSVLSAYHWLGVGDLDMRIVVYTDRPETFSTLEVATVVLDASTLKEWAGPAGFGHRRKILALRDALQRFDGPSAILDGDTYFRRSPTKLFGRIGPGRAQGPGVGAQKHQSVASVKVHGRCIEAGYLYMNSGLLSTKPRRCAGPCWSTALRLAGLSSG